MIKKIFSPRNLGAVIAILLVTGATALAAIPAYKSWLIQGTNLYTNPSPSLKIGIGTANPTEKLQVAGIIYSTTGGFRFPDGSLQTTASSGGIGGSGTPGIIPVFTGATALGDSPITTFGLSTNVQGNFFVGPMINNQGFFVDFLTSKAGVGPIPPPLGKLFAVDTVLGPTDDGSMIAWNNAPAIRAGIFADGQDQSFNYYDAGVLMVCGLGFGSWTCRGGGVPNALVTFPVGYTDRGYVSVHNGNWPTASAGMYVDPSGRGIVFGNVKNFREPNPDDPSTDIWYASVEGPEAAAYIRGTSRLANGQAIITFPDHFKAVAREVGMTVQLTPLSSDAKGLAVVQKSLNGIEVRELGGGSGTYDFDWEVKAVRKGYENYRVIRPKTEAQPAMPVFGNPSNIEKAAKINQ